MNPTASLRAFTKLLVLDLRASSHFYETLGFVRRGSDGTFVHYRWQEAGDVLLVQLPSQVRFEGKHGFGVLLCFSSTVGVDELASRAATLNAKVQGPDNQPWHTREIVVTDPDGYRLNFLEPLGALGAEPNE